MSNENTSSQQNDSESVTLAANKASSKIEGVKTVKHPVGVRTVGSMMGEIVWLLSQSPIHKHLSLADLEWLVMPPLILNQYKLFRDENKVPVGVALWAYLDEAAEEKLQAVGKLSPLDWGNGATLSAEKGMVATPGGNLWLVELVTPFHTEQNNHREKMLADLSGTVFARKEFKFFHVDKATQERKVVSLRGIDK